MDDTMLELTAGNQMLRRRLDAYADARLSPDATATARMRARVMAAAHRQAALTAAGAGLTVISSEPAPARRPLARHPFTRVAGVLLSAALGLSLAVGTALAADAGGALYPARLGLEVLLLPSEPSERVLAELDRLETRLSEAQAASARGDTVAVAAAMQAYAAILGTASADAIEADDPVASAALEAGVARNIQVLEALLERAPDAATNGLTRAIERSGTTIDEIRDAAVGGGSGGPGAGPGGPGESADPTARPAATAEPTPTTKPTKEPTAEPTPRPEKTPKPDRTPPGPPPGEPGDPGDPGPPDSGQDGGD